MNLVSSRRGAGLHRRDRELGTAASDAAPYGSGRTAWTVIARFEDRRTAAMTLAAVASDRVPSDVLRLATDLTAPGTTTGRLSMIRAATPRGLAVGGVFGIALAVVFSMLGLTDPLVSSAAVLVWGAFLGGSAGLVVSAVDLWFGERRHGSLAAPSRDAGQFVIVCDAEWAGRVAVALAHVV